MGVTPTCRIHVQNQDHQRAIELRPEGKKRSQSGNLGENILGRGAVRAKARSRSTADHQRSAWLMVKSEHGEVRRVIVGAPAFQALERGLCGFFRVGLCLRKIEQKVQSSHIYLPPKQCHLY